MSLFYSMIKLKKFYLLLFFCISSITLTFCKHSDRNYSKVQKCDYGKEYIKGQCVEPIPAIISNTDTPSFTNLPEAYIDENGVYKYIQIKCNDKIFIRGRKDCKYHKNIYNKFKQELNKLNLDAGACKVLGGGRINTNKKSKKIKIYGYSNRYGRVVNQHQVTKDILSKFYQDYDITWTNEGY